MLLVIEIPAATVGYLPANCFHFCLGTLYQTGLGSRCEFTGLVRAGIDFQRLMVTSEKVSAPPWLWTLLRLLSGPLVLEETELDLRLKITRPSEGLFLSLFLFLITNRLRLSLSGEGVRLPCCRIRQFSPERVPPVVVGLDLGLGGLIPLLILVSWLSSLSVLFTSLSKAERKASHLRRSPLEPPHCQMPVQYLLRSKSDQRRA